MRVVVIRVCNIQWLKNKFDLELCVYIFLNILHGKILCDMDNNLIVFQFTSYTLLNPHSCWLVAWPHVRRALHNFDIIVVHSFLLRKLLGLWYQRTMLRWWYVHIPLLTIYLVILTYIKQGYKSHVLYTHLLAYIQSTSYDFS